MVSWSRSCEGETHSPRLRLIAAYRSTEVDAAHPFRVVLADLVRMGLAAHSAVGPLSPAEANTLAQDLLSDIPTKEADSEALIQQLVGRAGAVPFYLVNCAQAMHARVLESENAQDSRETRHDSSRTEEAPWAVAEIIGQRASALTKPARDLLAVAGVIGRVAPHALLEAAITAATLLPEGEFLAALDEARRARLLVEREEGCRQTLGRVEYQFAHDLIHEVILHDMGTARRIQLHRAVATALEHTAQAQGKRESMAAEIADHFLQAEEPARALPYV